MCDELFPVIFDEAVMPKRVNQADGDDLIMTSACNFYDGVTQAEAEAFYDQQKKLEREPQTPPSYGLNTTLVKENGQVKELVWSANGKYSNAIYRLLVGEGCCRC